MAAINCHLLCNKFTLVFFLLLLLLRFSQSRQFKKSSPVLKMSIRLNCYKRKVSHPLKNRGRLPKLTSVMIYSRICKSGQSVSCWTTSSFGTANQKSSTQFSAFYFRRGDFTTGSELSHLRLRDGRAQSPEHLDKVAVSLDQSLLVDVHRRPARRDKVLHLPEAPAEDVHQEAARGRRRPAHPGVAVNVDGVTVLQKTME